MPLIHTRSLRALWGQRLTAYKPPYSPSAFINGHALMRYAVSGPSTSLPVRALQEKNAASAGAALHSAVFSSEWQPSSTPAEVVLNANESEPFCSIQPASPQDVELFTQLLMTSDGRECTVLEAAQLRHSAMLHDKPGGTASLPLEAAEGFTVSRNTSSSSPVLPADPDNTVDFAAHALHTLTVLYDTLRLNLTLLAGAESLQTGVPLRYLLRELKEAKLYLRWSRASLRESRCVCRTVKGSRARESGATVQAAENDDDIDDDDDDDVPACEDVREMFAAEVACLQTQLQQQQHKKKSHQQQQQNKAYTMSMNEEDGAVTSVVQPPSLNQPSQHQYVSAQTTESENSCSACRHVPLVTLVTSTHNSLASALKAAAVCWAACGPAPSSFAAACAAVVPQMMWCPAPGTGLVAAWWMVLMRTQLQALTTSSAAAVAGKDDRSSEATEQTVLDDRSVSDSAASGECAERIEESYNHKVISATETKRGEERRQVEPLFHVCLTGADTEAHFIRPWLEGIVHATATSYHECTLSNLSDSASAPMSDAAHRDVAAGNMSGGTTSCPLLLLYGCPASQVRHIKRLLSTRRQPHRSLAHHSPHFLSRPADEKTRHVGADVVTAELRTEVDTTALVMSSSGGEGSATVASPSSFSAALELPYRVLQVARGPAADSSIEAQRLCPRLRIDRSFRDVDSVASELFSHGVLELPFSRVVARQQRHGDTTRLTTATTSGCGVGAAHQDLPPLSTSKASVHRIPGWCSLCFVPQHCTAAILRMLAQQHFKEPWYVGHSLDATTTRRGPAPSAAHVSKMQEMLRAATRGPERAEEEKEEEVVVVRNREEGRDTSATASTETGADDTAASLRADKKDTKAPRILWRHGCGGFPLPLTAVRGRGSPYVLPSLLFTDLETAMTARELTIMKQYVDLLEKESMSGTGQADSMAVNIQQPHSNPESDTSHTRRHQCAATSAAQLMEKEKEELRAAVQGITARAADRIQANVQGLTDAFDTAEMGYRGVAGGNFLFVCRYPSALEACLAAAVGDRDGMRSVCSRECVRECGCLPKPKRAGCESVNR